MKSKPGAAMVEMGDCYAVDRAINNLNNNFLFSQKINVWWVQLIQTPKYLLLKRNCAVAFNNFLNRVKIRQVSALLLMQVSVSQKT